MGGPGRPGPVHFKLVPLAVVRWEKCGGLLGRQEPDGSIQMEDWETWPGTGRGHGGAAAPKQSYAGGTSLSMGEATAVGGVTEDSGLLKCEGPQRGDRHNLQILKRKLVARGVDAEAREVLFKSGGHSILGSLLRKLGRQHLHECVRVRDLGQCTLSNDEYIINTSRGKTQGAEDTCGGAA